MEGTTKTGSQLDPAFVEEWSRRYLDVWNSLEADGVAAMCTEDIVWHDPGLPEPAHGREGVRGFVRATASAFPDFHVEELEQPYISAQQPRALAPYRMTGTMLGPWDYANLAATGHRIEVLGVDEWTFRGELMSHYRTYYDSLDMARQLGVLPPPGSPADRAMGTLQHLQARFQRRKSR
ncbi:MAG: ester cyclase [Solirubrobacterales bacterium]